MPEMNERERLIGVIAKGFMVDILSQGEISAEEIADFILADRRRILEEVEKHLLKHTWGHKSVNDALATINKYKGE